MMEGKDAAVTAPAGKLPRTVTVVGCGRLGAHLASRLSAEGCSVVVIDRDERAFDRLAPGFSGFRGAGAPPPLARRPAAPPAQWACRGGGAQNDNVNLMVAQMAATILEVPRVLVRVFDPAREEIYRDFGLRTVSPTRLAVEEMIRVLRLEDDAGGDAGGGDAGGGRDGDAPAPPGEAVR